MTPWKSFHAPMEIIPWIHRSHWKIMVTKDMEITTCMEVIIFTDAWDFYAPSTQWTSILGAYKHFHGRLWFHELFLQCIVQNVSLGVIGGCPMSRFPISKATGEIHQWWNSCRAQFYHYVYCRGTPPSFGDQKVEIISRLVSTPAVFQDNGSWKVFCVGRIRTSKAF